MPSRLAAVVCLSLLTGAPAAADPDFAGDWIHLGDRMGFFIGHVEVLQLLPSGAAQVQLFISRGGLPACEEPSGADLPACRLPLLTDRGRLVVDHAANRLRIEATERVAAPEEIPDAAELWAQIGAAADPGWTFELEDDLLVLSRTFDLGGNRLSLENRFHRVDAAMPGELYAFLRHFWLSITAAGCAVDAIMQEPALRDEFRTLLAATAPVIAAVDAARDADFAAPVTPPRIEAFGKALGAPPGSPPPAGLAPGDWDAYRAAFAWIRDGEARTLIPAAAPLADAIESCISDFY